MIWKFKTTPLLETIARTGYLTSVVSYVIFWVTDLVIPGFVSRYFSVHVFLLTALVCGFVWGSRVKEYTERAWLHQGMALLFGILLSVIVWNSSEGLDGYRLVVSLMALVTPTVVYALIKD
jgi:hypothetical protein